MLALPAASLAAPLAMSIVISPSAVGATLKVACVGLTLRKSLIVPLPTTTSFASNPLTDSEKLTVTGMLAAFVGPATPREIDAVGLVESCVIVGTALAVDSLVAESVAVTIKRLSASAVSDSLNENTVASSPNCC